MQFLSLYSLRERGHAAAAFTSIDFYPAAQVRKCRPSRIRGARKHLVTAAGIGVLVGATARAESFAVLAAKRPGGQGQEHLFAQDVFKRETAVLIIADFRLGRSNRMFRQVGIGAEGTEDEVEVAREGVPDGVDAAGAGHLELTAVVAAQANVLDDLPGTAVLFNQIGTAGGGQGGLLLHVGGVIDLAGLEGKVVLERLALEFGDGDEHGGLGRVV